MPLEQIKPAFSFYDSYTHSGTSKQQTSGLSESAHTSPSRSPTSLPYYYHSSLRSNKVGNNLSQNDGRGDHLPHQPYPDESDQEAEVEYSRRGGLKTQTLVAEDEDSTVSSPPSALSPPEADYLARGDTQDRSHGIRSIGQGGNYAKENDQQDRHHSPWSHASRSSSSAEKKSPSEDGNLTIHRDETDEVEEQELFRDSRSRQSSHESSNRYSNPYSWYSAAESGSRERGQSREDTSVLTKLGGVGGVTRSGSWGRNDARTLSSEGRQSLGFQGKFLGQDDASKSGEQNIETKQRRKDFTEGRSSPIGVRRGIRSIGKRRSIPTPSPPASPVDEDDASGSQLAYLSQPRTESASASVPSSTAASRPLNPDQVSSSTSEVLDPTAPSFSRTSTTSTSSTRFSHTSTNSNYSDSSYSSYASSTANVAPSALSLRSVSGSIKSNRDKDRNRDSSSSLRSTRSAYSHKETAMEEQHEDTGASVDQSEAEAESLAQVQNPKRAESRRDASEETTATETGDQQSSTAVEGLQKLESTNGPSDVVSSPEAGIPAALVSDSNSGFSAGGFGSVSKGLIAPVAYQETRAEQLRPSQRREGSNSSVASEKESEWGSNPSTSSSPISVNKRQTNRRLIAPLTLASVPASTSSNPNIHPPVIESSGFAAPNRQLLESPSAASSNTQFQFEPPIPRRHSGIYLARTRSALSSRHPTINSRFEHGHGGRAAARERENTKEEGTEQKLRNMSGSSSLSSGGRAYAASHPASPLILSSSGSSAVSEWQGLPALNPIVPALRSDLDASVRTPQAARAPLPSPGSTGLGSTSYFESGSRRGSSSASTTPMPSANQFASQHAQALSPLSNPANFEASSSFFSSSLRDREASQALTVLTGWNSTGERGDIPPTREATFGLGISPASTPNGLSESEGSGAASTNKTGSISPVSRPKMQRASTTGHGMGLKLAGGAGHVLRTPTTEEWTRFLAERGGSAGMSGIDFRQLRLAAAYGNATGSSVAQPENPPEVVSRSRSSSLLPCLATGIAAASSSSLPDASSGNLEDQDEAQSQTSSSGSDPGENLQIAASMLTSRNLVATDPMLANVGVLERLRQISADALSAFGERSLGRRTAPSSRASSSVRGSDLESLHEEDDEDEDEALDSSSEEEMDETLEMHDLDPGGIAPSAGRGRHGSSSSLERMNALYEAISRPQSRVTSPVISPFGSPNGPSSPILNRLSPEQDPLGSSFRSVSSNSLSLEVRAKGLNLGASPSSGSNPISGPNLNADPNTIASPSSPNRYQSPLLVNANTRRGSSHSQSSSPNTAGLSASSSFASTSVAPGAVSGSSLLPPSSDAQLTRESTMRPQHTSVALSEAAPKSSLATKREAANASATERQVAAHAFGYPLPPPGTSRCINDFVVTADIGRGAYGLVKKVRIKGADRDPIGDEFVIKYIIKSRILADCWRRHRVLGPIPIEIHVMDQLRRLSYDAPAIPHSWSPEVLARQSGTPTSSRPPSGGSTPLKQGQEAESPAASSTNTNLHPTSSTPTHQLHPNICPMVDFFEDHEFYYLIMPVFGRGQDLFDYVESLPDGLSAVQVRSIFGQVADALSFLHINSIVHRDIKDENVILNFRAGAESDNSQAIPTAQLIDFGSATHIRPGRLFDTFSGTLDYAAAEILRGEKYGGREQDVWALGVVGYVLLCGECPFWNGEEAVLGLTPDSRAATALQERCFPPDPSDGDSQDDSSKSRLLADVEGQEDGGGRLCDAADLIARCLELDQTARPSAQQICSHKFLIGSKGWRGPRGWLGENLSRFTVLIDGERGESVHTSA